MVPRVVSMEKSVGIQGRLDVRNRWRRAGCEGCGGTPAAWRNRGAGAPMAGEDTGGLVPADLSLVRSSTSIATYATESGVCRRTAGSVHPLRLGSAQASILRQAQDRSFETARKHRASSGGPTGLLRANGVGFSRRIRRHTYEPEDLELILK